MEVLADEVIVSERPREGWSVVNEQGETVALDLELTPELVRAGLVREVVRLVQDARKTSGFEVSDRITLVWAADGELAEALREGTSTVAAEVLATEVVEGEPQGDVRRDEELGLPLRGDPGLTRVTANPRSVLVVALLVVVAVVVPVVGVLLVLGEQRLEA